MVLDMPGAVEVVRTYADGAERRQVVAMLTPTVALVSAHWPPPDGVTHTGEVFQRLGNPEVIAGDVAIVRLKSPITGVQPVRWTRPQVGMTVYDTDTRTATVRNVYPAAMFTRLLPKPGDSGSPIYARFDGEYVLVGAHWSTGINAAIPVSLAIAVPEQVTFRHPCDFNGDGVLNVNDMIEMAQAEPTPEEAAEFARLFGMTFDGLGDN